MELMPICRQQFLIQNLVYVFRVPFAHSIDLECFEKLKKGPYNEHAFCDNQAACVSGGGECLKPEGLEIGWGYKGDRVHVSMQQGEIFGRKLSNQTNFFLVGEPILCECPQKFDGINNKWSSIDVQVDDHIIWFRLGPTDDQCSVSFASCNPPFVCNSVKQSKIYGLNPMTWEIRYKDGDLTYYRLLSLYLLPQKAAFQHQGGKNITRKAPNGPKCNIQLRIVSLKILAVGPLL